MFYDFSIPYKDDKLRMSKLIQRAQSVGYDVIAIDHIVSEKFAPNHVNPIPKLLEEIASLNSSIDFRINSQNTMDVALDCPVEEEEPLPTTGAGGIISRGWHGQRKIRILSRLTVVLNDPSRAQCLKNNIAVTKQYDIIAVKPANENLLVNAITNLDIDIVSFDMSKVSSFYFKHHTVQPAKERGIYFEIPYTPAIRDSNSRKNLFYNANNLMRALHGANAIFVSGAEEAIELRGPYDVANLGSLFSINQSIAKTMVSNNGRSLLLRAETRKSTEKAVVSVAGKIHAKSKNRWKGGNNDDNPSKKPRFETIYNDSKIDQ